MTAFSTLRAGAAAVALLIAGSPAAAQVVPAPQFMPAPTPTADALAAQMRQLGVNPRDVYALIAAGELSTKLGDPAAALSFFGRAQAIEPTNPRIAAGKAGALVLLERPGEALQLYAQAERAGVAMTPYLTQRGLAYDLIGQPGYAQRDYRRALLIDHDDETVRRLALSLGISGHRDEAMALLDPLLRRNDRAAWRTRACVLALTGDVAGAQKIAASMMAGGAALSPFFGRLQSLSPADRAFAVHFGEVSSTVARANDARLAPVLAALPATSQQASVSPAPVVAGTAAAVPEQGRRDIGARRPARSPVAIAAAMPAPQEPPWSPTRVATRDPLPAPLSRGVTPSSRSPAPLPVQPSASPAASWAVTADTPRPAIATAKPSATPIEIVTLPSRPRADTAVAAPPPARPETASAPASVAAQPSVATPPPAAAETPAAQPAGSPAAAAPTPAPAPEPAAIPARRAPAPAQMRTPAIARRNTEMLAAIIGTISVPASELDAAPPPRKAVMPRVKPVETLAKADPKAADARKADARKTEPKKPDPAKADPARWWAQVAGGANAADLTKDWKRLTAKSPAAFRGKGAWTTPLRATNRLLAGPFASQGEAMTFVNLLAKDGTSAFAWQSEAGQKIDRLGAK